MDKETRLKLNKLAREQMKLKLLSDIRIDCEICKIEGWDFTEYIKELYDILNEFYSKNYKNY